MKIQYSTPVAETLLALALAFLLALLAVLATGVTGKVENLFILRLRVQLSLTIAG
jgi:HAMP domain-containing protein